MNQKNNRGYEFVNPKKAHSKVFVFPIQNNLNSGISTYESTCRAWPFSKSMREEPFGIAVGIKDKISQGVFEIKNWHLYNQANKRWEFDGIETDKTDGFHNTNWSQIIDKAIGYWQFGNYLVVEFNGKGQFRFIRGGDKKWSFIN